MGWIRRAGLVLGHTGAVLLCTGQLSAQGLGPGDALDYGVGIISFESFPAPGTASLAADTLVIHQSASMDSPVVARFLLRVPEPFAWDYALETEADDVQSNALEFDYEVLGLPIDSLAPGGEWGRVVYGFAGMEPRHGWVRNAEGKTQVLFWAETLLDGGHDLFFLDPDRGVAFYDRPTGDRIPLELAPGREPGNSSFDYRLEPLEVEGRWMKARVVTPDAAGEEIRA